MPGKKKTVFPELTRNWPMLRRLKSSYNDAGLIWAEAH